MPTTQSPRQTQTYLRDLFEARGLRPKSKLGQCFLTDLNMLELIVRTAELTADDLVLEVGSGTGGLTVKLAEQSRAVLGVELDTAFYQLARESTAALANVTLINADILRNKNQINPGVLERLDALRQASGAVRMKLVANLPYVVATPVISNFLIAEIPFERMVVTIQWELAQRLIARPSTKDYGALSVLVQSLADVEVIRKLPPNVFWPRPKVESALVAIRPNADKRTHVGDVQRFREFLRALYTHRRKNLRGALAAAYGEKLDKQRIDDLLQRHAFDTTGRAEQLSVAEHFKLCGILANETSPKR